MSFTEKTSKNSPPRRLNARQIIHDIIPVALDGIYKGQELKGHDLILVQLVEFMDKINKNSLYIHHWYRRTNANNARR
ncbi:hypothetical protein DSUL_50440 [Desulfovibrionales bacterium]